MINGYCEEKYTPVKKIFENYSNLISKYINDFKLLIIKPPIDNSIHDRRIWTNSRQFYSGMGFSGKDNKYATIVGVTDYNIFTQNFITKQSKGGVASFASFAILAFIVVVFIVLLTMGV